MWIILELFVAHVSCRMPFQTQPYICRGFKTTGQFEDNQTILQKPRGRHYESYIRDIQFLITPTSRADHIGCGESVM